jgi:type II secretion system protein N
MTPDRLRTLRRLGLNAAFALGVFAVALYLSFPYDRAKEIAIRLAAQKDLDVEIGSAGPAFGLAVSFHDILVRTRPTPGPTGAPSKPTRFFIESARVSASPWSLLSSVSGFSLALSGFGGRVDFDQRGTPGKKGSFATEIHARDVKLAELPGVKDALSIPLAGALKLDLQIKSETG